MRRPNRINVDWETPEGTGGFSWEHVHVELLMDIRSELRRLNTLLNCRNFTEMPMTLRAIHKNTTKPKRKTIKP